MADDDEIDVQRQREPRNDVDGFAVLQVRRHREAARAERGGGFLEIRFHPRAIDCERGLRHEFACEEVGRRVVQHADEMNLAAGDRRQLRAFVDGHAAFGGAVEGNENLLVHDYLPCLRMNQAGTIASVNARVTTAKHSWKGRAGSMSPIAADRHSRRTASTLTPTAPPSWRT